MAALVHDLVPEKFGEDTIIQVYFLFSSAHIFVEEEIIHLIFGNGLAAAIPRLRYCGFVPQGGGFSARISDTKS